VVFEFWVYAVKNRVIKRKGVIFVKMVEHLGQKIEQQAIFPTVGKSMENTVGSTLGFVREGPLIALIHLKNAARDSQPVHPGNKNHTSCNVLQTTGSRWCPKDAKHHLNAFCHHVSTFAFHVRVFEEYAAVFKEYAAVLSEYAAVFKEYAAVLSEYAAVFKEYAAVLSEYAAVFKEYAAVLSEYAAVFKEYAAVLSEYAAVFKEYAAVLSEYVFVLNVRFNRPKCL
jgi:hypothetical protein